jgi:hypothetical protein
MTNKVTGKNEPIKLFKNITTIYNYITRQHNSTSPCPQPPKGCYCGSCVRKRVWQQFISYKNKQNTLFDCHMVA